MGRISKLFLMFFFLSSVASAQTFNGTYTVKNITATGVGTFGSNTAEENLIVNMRGWTDGTGQVTIGTDNTFGGGYNYPVFRWRQDGNPTSVRFDASNFVLYSSNPQLFLQDSVNGTQAYISFFDSVGAGISIQDNLPFYFGSSEVNTTGNVAGGTFNSGTLSGNNSGDQASSDFSHNSLSGLNDGTDYEHITQTEKTNFGTAYDHSQDNTQAHSDYLINNGDDTTSGTVTACGFSTTGTIKTAELAGTTGDCSSQIDVLSGLTSDCFLEIDEVEVGSGTVNSVSGVYFWINSSGATGIPDTSDDTLYYVRMTDGDAEDSKQIIQASDSDGGPDSGGELELADSSLTSKVSAGDAFVILRQSKATSNLNKIEIDGDIQCKGLQFSALTDTLRIVIPGGSATVNPNDVMTIIGGDGADYYSGTGTGDGSSLTYVLGDGGEYATDAGDGGSYTWTCGDGGGPNCYNAGDGGSFTINIGSKGTGVVDGSDGKFIVNGNSLFSGNVVIQADTTGEVLRLETLNGASDITSWIGYDEYGYYWKYLGSGSGDNNELQLWTDGASGDDDQVYGIKQSGNIEFKQDVSVLGTITANDKIIFTQSDGNEYIDSLADGYMDYRATTGHRFNAPITIASKALLGTPASGTLEFYGNKLYVTNKSLQKVIDRTSDVKVTTTTVDGDSGAQGTTETTVFTASVPANSWVAGNILKLKMFGEISNDAGGDAVTIAIKVGGDEVASMTSDGRKLTDDPWIIDGTCIVRTIGASGEMAWTMTGKIQGQDRAFTSDVSAIDTTGALDITVTAKWDAADADNIFLCTGGFMEYKN